MKYSSRKKNPETIYVTTDYRGYIPGLMQAGPIVNPICCNKTDAVKMIMYGMKLTEHEAGTGRTVLLTLQNIDDPNRFEPVTLAAPKHAAAPVTLPPVAENRKTLDTDLPGAAIPRKKAVPTVAKIITRANTHVFEDGPTVPTPPPAPVEEPATETGSVSAVSAKRNKAKKNRNRQYENPVQEQPQPQQQSALEVTAPAEE